MVCAGAAQTPASLRSGVSVSVLVVASAALRSVRLDIRNEERIVLASARALPEPAVPHQPRRSRQDVVAADTDAREDVEVRKAVIDVRVDGMEVHAEGRR